MKILFSLFIALLVFTGCGETPKPKDPKPEWVLKRSVGVIGVCKSHLRGNAVQEEVAMDRALKKLAKAKQSRIISSSVDVQKETNGRYKSAHETQANVSSDATVSSHEAGTWRNPRNNTYYVWMVPN